MIVANLPALQVVLPLVAAPLCVLLRNGKAAWILAQLVSLACLAISISLVLEVLGGGDISYAMGGWEPPWGIELRIDLANAFVLVIVATIAAIVLVFAPRSVASEVPAERQAFFYCAYLLCITGLFGITATGDAFNLFVFLEISSLSSYTLIAMGRDRRALRAAYQYLIMGTIGATFYLIGVGLLYLMTGTLNMADLATRIPAISGSPTVQAAFAFLIIGVALKAAIFPLHAWLPNAYAYSPSVVSALLAATSTKVSIYVLIRIVYTFFGVRLAFTSEAFELVLMILALAGMVIASIIAIYQVNAKRLLAFSSVAQIGYMILGLAMGSVAGLAACLIHLFNHALIKGGLFLVLGCIVYRSGSAMVRDLSGLGRAMPWTMGAFVVGGLSLIGVPLTTGFISKWALLRAALDQELWLVAGVIVFASLLAVIYVWRIVERAYFTERPAGAPPVQEAPLSLLLPTWALMLANLYFGIDSTATLGLAERAAAALAGTPQ